MSPYFCYFDNHGGVIEVEERRDLITRWSLSYKSERIVISWGVSELGVVYVNFKLILFEWIFLPGLEPPE